MELASKKEIDRIVALLNRTSPVTHVHLFGLNSSAVHSAFHSALDTLKDSGCIVLPVNLLLTDGSVPKFCSELLRKVMDMPLGVDLKKVKTLHELYEVLSVIAKESIRPIVIALSRAEYFTSFPELFLLALFKCIKKENGKIKALTISHLLWSQIETVGLVSIPVQIGFKSFTKVDLCKVLQNQLGKESREIKLSIDLTFATCRDPRMLKHMIKCRDNKCKGNQGKNEMKNMLNYYATNGFSSTSFKGLPKTDANGLNLPLSEVILLIAAFCATYNPSTSDSRIFGNKKSKALSEMDQRRRTTVFEKTPKPFDLQRLTFIYLALLRYLNMAVLKDSNIFVLVNDLCSLGLLVKTSADGNLDIPKYKCTATEEFLMKTTKFVFFTFVFILMI
uniref:Origin recognition complex subunit 5 n=1 Tax=Syphacia muris TaxID=451379 RepID=A0A0N5AVG3_9BILA